MPAKKDRKRPVRRSKTEPRQRERGNESRRRRERNGKSTRPGTDSDGIPIRMEQDPDMDRLRGARFGMKVLIRKRARNKPPSLYEGER